MNRNILLASLFGLSGVCWLVAGVVAATAPEPPLPPIPSSGNRTSDSVRSLVPEPEPAEETPKPEPLTREYFLRECPLSDGFDFPVGPPDAKKYYDAQPFGKNYHLGEDWNGRGGGNTDLEDPIYSISTGIVTYTGDVGGGWGKIVRILHNAGTEEEPRYVESLYAHFTEMHVAINQVVEKGEQIGTMGNCDGRYWSHLHFELRKTPFMGIGGAYGADKMGYLNPTRFINKHRTIVR